MFETLKILCELPGPTGQEEQVQSFLREIWGRYTDRIEITGIGNLVAHIGGEGEKVLITAHSDEIGFVVKNISPEGFLWITSAQVERAKAPLRAFLSHPVSVLGRRGEVEGVLAAVTGHVMSFQQREKKEIEWRELFIDIGASSREEARSRGVGIGSRVVFKAPLRRMGKLYCGKAMDDRVGLAIMSQLLEEVDSSDLKYDLHLVSTVQEEIGLMGAASLFKQGDFQLCIALECGQAGDIPTVEERDMPVKLGEGPILVHKDSMVHYSRSIIQRLREVAEREDIPVQDAVFSGFGSDGAALIRQGVPTALIAPPTRYTHSPFEMVHEDDLRAAVMLLKSFLTKCDDAQ